MRVMWTREIASSALLVKEIEIDRREWKRRGCRSYSAPVKYSLAQQVRLGPAIPHPLDQFHPADLPLALSSAPWAGQRQLDGFVILAETPGDGVEFFQPRPAGFMAPGIQGFKITLFDDLVKPPFELVSLGQRGIDLERPIWKR